MVDGPVKGLPLHSHLSERRTRRIKIQPVASNTMVKLGSDPVKIFLKRCKEN